MPTETTATKRLCVSHLKSTLLMNSVYQSKQ